VQVDIKTSDIRPIRQTFSHVARRLGDKPASRYQEATLDMQPTANFHYRPLWAPEYELYDKRRTAIVMADWYSFKDPRHYYYGVYTMTRARQQEGADRQFEFADKRKLLVQADAATREALQQVLVPLRHYEWGANMNMSACCGYGYGTAVTQPASTRQWTGSASPNTCRASACSSMPNTGSALDAGKRTWLTHPAWQGVRRVMERLFVTADWFEVFLAQNLVFDGLLYPLVYRRYVDKRSPATGNALAC
jgi:phenol hydroxylase P1 protein